MRPDSAGSAADTTPREGEEARWSTGRFQATGAGVDADRWHLALKAKPVELSDVLDRVERRLTSAIHGLEQELGVTAPLLGLRAYCNYDDPPPAATAVTAADGATPV